MPALLVWCGRVAPEGKVSICTSFVLALINLAGFVSNFYLSGVVTAFGEFVHAPIMIAMPVLAIMTIIFIVYNPFKEAPATGSAT